MNKFERVIKENQEATRTRYFEKKRRQKREQLKENVLFGLVTFAILGMTVIILMNMTNSEMANCMSAGHSEQYCASGL